MKNFLNTQETTVNAACCAIHPERVAANICGRCGIFACTECLSTESKNYLCYNCAKHAPPTKPLPWEQRRQMGFFKAYWKTCLQVMLNPSSTFQQTSSQTGSLKEPIYFALMSQFVGISGILLIYGFISLPLLIMSFNESSAISSIPTIVAIILVIIILLLIIFPLGSLLMVFIHAGLEHLLLRLFGVKTQGFETTARGYCYSMAPMIWGAIPICGAYVYPIWQIICRVYAYKWFHQTTGGKAALAILLPMALLIGSLVALYIVIIIAAVMSNLA